MPDSPDNSGADKEQTLLSHLTELRTRLLHAIVCVLVLFLGLAFFSNEIYLAIASPLIEQLPANTSMIATEIAAPFLEPFKCTIFVAIFIAMPYLLYQAWAFVAPGLYDKERYFVLPLLFVSSLLFYCGIAFAFYVVFPLIFKFFALTAPEGISFMPDIGAYLNFILKLFLAFGLAFEVPIITIMLVKSGATDVQSLAKKRPYIIVGAFAAGMLLTPPDVISQMLLALPIWVLFESGLLMCKFFVKNSEDEELNETN